MIGIKTRLALTLGKSLKYLINAFGKSGGSAAPGLLANSIDKNFIKNLSAQISGGSIVISGTNGKTTTARLISKIFNDCGYLVIHNRAGSNLLRGIASTLIENSHLLKKEKTIALWEVDEATLPNAVDILKPNLIILLNLFRDQLDRYGEIDRIKNLWHKALKGLTDTTLLLNADDPAVAHLGHDLKLKSYYFGIESKNVASAQLSSHADTKYCGQCQSQLEYECVYISHLGIYKCPSCKNKRPEPDFYAENIKLAGISGSSFKFNFKGGKHQINSNIAGLYNVYNICAALSAISVSNLSIDSALKSIVNFSGAFGRVEKIKFKDRTFYILLVKNPAGANEVVRTIFSDNSKKKLAVVINDNFADGRDVSWLWDVDFEKIKHKLNLLLVSGLRAEDIALRLKYADLGIEPKIIRQNNLFDKIINLTKSKDIIFILPTYTALLDINKQLSKLKITKSYWQS